MNMYQRSGISRIVSHVYGPNHPFTPTHLAVLTKKHNQTQGKEKRQSQSKID